MQRIVICFALLISAQTGYTFDLTLSDEQLTALIMTQMGQVKVSEDRYLVDKPLVNCHADGRVSLLLDVHVSKARLGRFRVSAVLEVRTDTREVVLTELNVEIIQPEPHFTHTAAAHLARWRGHVESTQRQLTFPLSVLPAAELIRFDRVSVQKGQMTLSTSF